MADETNLNTNTSGESGAQAAQNQPAATHSAPQENPSNLRMFTQEQLDAIISRERSKAAKGLFTPDQMNAKDTTIAALTSERDAANADKAKLQEQLDALQHEKYLSQKGVPADMLEFYAFKIGKLVTDKKTFEQAAEDYLKENPPAGTVRMSTGGGVNNGSGSQPNKPNDIMNALIRGARE